MAVSTITAIVLGVNKGAIRAGLSFFFFFFLFHRLCSTHRSYLLGIYGYNGVLVGLAIATFYSNLSFGLLAGPIVFCSILSVFLSLGLSYSRKLPLHFIFSLLFVPQLYQIY